MYTIQFLLGPSNWNKFSFHKFHISWTLNVSMHALLALCKKSLMVMELSANVGEGGTLGVLSATSAGSVHEVLIFS